MTNTVQWARRAAAGAILSALAGVGAAGAQQTVVAGFMTAPTLSIAPQMMTFAMGYYKDAGLDVKVTPFEGAATLLPQLAQRHVDFGWINPDVLIVSRQPGRDPVPIKAYYNGIPLSPYEIVVLKDSPLKTLDDLKDKKIGVGAMSWGNLAATKAQLRGHNMEFQKDYQLVPVGTGATAFRALTTGQIDALNLFDTLHTQLELTGVAIRRLPQDQKFLDLFSSSWVTHNDTLKDKRALVVAFTRATIKGVIACNANPEACVKNFWKMYPNTKPAEGSEEEKMKTALAILKTRLVTMIPHGSTAEMGFYKDDAWKDYVEVLHEGGQLKSTEVPVKELYTNDLVKEINDIDVEAVVKAAKAL